MQKENFEDLVKQVDETIKKLEVGGLGLEAATTEYETGMKALGKCHEILVSTEKRWERLLVDELPDEGGRLKRKPLEC